MKKKQMCVDFHAYLSGVTHMRQEFTVCQIKSHFSIVCRFYLFSHQNNDIFLIIGISMISYQRPPCTAFGTTSTNILRGLFLPRAPPLAGSDRIRRVGIRRR